MTIISWGRKYRYKHGGRYGYNGRAHAGHRSVRCGVERSSGSVGTGASVSKMLDHIALLRAIKKEKKKKNFSRPTDPASRRASMDRQTIFFIGLMARWNCSYRLHN